MNRSFLYAVGFFLAGYAVLPAPVHAGTIYLSEKDSSGSLNSYSPNFGRVDYTLVDSTHATFTFTALSAGGKFYGFSGNNAANLNVNGPVTVGTITASGPSGPVTTYARDTTGGDNVDGFGTFNFRTTDGGGGGAGTAVTSISFTLTLTSGSWANEGAILLANGGANVASAHVFVFDNAAFTQPINNVPTGFVADGPNEGITEVPEPATMSLAAVGLIGFAGYAWRKRRQKAAA